MLTELEEITNLIAALPGIGRKSAQRIALHFLKQDSSYLTRFIESLRDFYQNVTPCPTCGALKSVRFPCEFCDPQRDNTILCVVEQPSDIYAIEKSGEHKGLYHVLMGVLSPLDGITPEDLTLQQLKNRVMQSQELREVIIATNPSIEGNATAHYIARLLADKPNLKISRLASGLALGSQLEFADSQAISLSLRTRIPIEL